MTSDRAVRTASARVLSSDALLKRQQWQALWRGLCAGRAGFADLPQARQNEVLGSLADLGLSTGNIVRVLKVTKGLVLARARDYPKVVTLQGGTDQYRAMNRYLLTLPRPR
jgi:hypothetical protein